VKHSLQAAKRLSFLEDDILPQRILAVVAFLKRTYRVSMKKTMNNFTLYCVLVDDLEKSEEKRH